MAKLLDSITETALALQLSGDILIQWVDRKYNQELARLKEKETKRLKEEETKRLKETEESNRFQEEARQT